MRSSAPVLMVVTDPSVPDLARRVDEAVAGGVRWVQFRDKRVGAEAPDWLCTFKERHPDTVLIVNGDSTLAGLIGADGVHLPSNASGVEAIRAAHGPRFIVGRSVHGEDAALRGGLAEADYLVFGSVYATASHPDAPPAGIEALAKACRALAPVPVLAIGGIHSLNAGECVGAGAAGVAAIRSVLMAPDPGQAAVDIIRAMGEAK